MRSLRTVGAAPVCGLVLVSSLLLVVAPAGASVMRYLPIEELAAESTQVVRALITSQSVHWSAGRAGIYTQIEAVVTGEIKTDPAVRAGQGRRLTIIQAGGEIDGVSLDWTGRPTFEVGEDLVLFLQPYDDKDLSDPRLLVVGGKQGRMRVVPGSRPGDEPMVERSLQGVLEAPGISGDRPSGPAPRRDLLGMDELRRRVLAAGGGR